MMSLFLSTQPRPRCISWVTHYILKYDHENSKFSILTTNIHSPSPPRMLHSLRPTGGSHTWAPSHDLPMPRWWWSLSKLSAPEHSFADNFRSTTTVRLHGGRPGLRRRLWGGRHGEGQRRSHVQRRREDGGRRVRRVERGGGGRGRGQVGARRRRQVVRRRVVQVHARRLADRHRAQLLLRSQCLQPGDVLRNITAPRWEHSFSSSSTFREHWRANTCTLRYLSSPTYSNNFCFHVILYFSHILTLHSCISFWLCSTN